MSKWCTKNPASDPHQLTFYLTYILTSHLAFFLAFYLTYILNHSDIQSGILSDILSGIVSGTLSDILSCILSAILFRIFSGILIRTSHSRVRARNGIRVRASPDWDPGPLVPIATSSWHKVVDSGGRRKEVKELHLWKMQRPSPGRWEICVLYTKLI